LTEQKLHLALEKLFPLSYW